jgi:hypothetical protein
MKIRSLLNNVSLLLCHCGFKASEEWQYMQETERAWQVWTMEYMNEVVCRTMQWHLQSSLGCLMSCNNLPSNQNPNPNVMKSFSMFFSKFGKKIWTGNTSVFIATMWNLTPNKGYQGWTKYSNILYYIRVKTPCIQFSLNYCQIHHRQMIQRWATERAFVTLWTWLEHEGLMTQLLSSTVYIDGQTCMWCLLSLFVSLSS